MAVAIAVGVVLRFVTTSPLWLDEALSANIARLPVGDIFEALRHDGHPPLYYVVLHAWMAVFGEGDAAVRALSGVLGVLTLPLAYLAGRRRAGVVGGAAVTFLVAVAPFSLRYATEARMYSLLLVLVFAGWLVADDLRRRPDRRRWVALALLTGAGLLTHYWVVYLVAAGGVAVGLAWWRSGERAAALRIGTALAAGGLLFVPWIPTFLHQVAHTGTPWGRASRPTRALVDLAVGLGGRGVSPEAVLFGIAVLVLAAIGLTARRRDGNRLELDLATTPLVRSELAVAALVFSIGLAAGALTAATFMARYAAVFLPLVFIGAGIGLAQLPAGWPRRAVAMVLAVLAAAGALVNVIDDRTQGEDFATHIARHGAAGDLVVFCPDQLGPSTLRYLPDGFDAAGVPSLEPPVRIDWVDYTERNESADARRVVDELLARAGDSTIWLVYNGGYRTYEELCPEVFAALAAARPDQAQRLEQRERVEEVATLYEFRP